MKIERFQCFLYGRLIALILSSSLVFTLKSIIHETKNKEISEFKSFSVVKEHFNKLSKNIFKGELALGKIFNSILKNILRRGIKSKRKERKRPSLILENIKFNKDDIKKLAI